MSTSNSNQRYGVWDSYNDMALSLSPSSSNPELCMAKGCNELVGASALAMGYRLCTKCIMKHTDALQRRSERSEQNNEQRFNDALQRAEFTAQREEWLAAIPASWKV